jgi:5'(3')-deoxyribonucleotidase
MIIAIDLDDTLSDMLPVWLAACNEEYGCNVTKADILSWNIYEYVPCGKDIYKYLTPALFRKFHPMPDAIGVTERLAQQHTLLIVSSCTPGTFDVKRDWAKWYFPHIKTFIAASDKHYINCDILIDDGAHNLEGVGIERGICFDQPHNQAWQGRRVYNWLEVENILAP